MISPPYDIISPQEQALYYRKNPYNIIRLEYPQEQSGDSAQNNKYTRAASTMGSWLREDILVQEEHPAFYLVEHCFPYHGALKSHWGLIARIRLEDLSTGWIRPHEITRGEAVTDRLRLLKSCQASFSPIMGMFRHESDLSLFANLATNQPALSAVDSYGLTYRTWVVTDKETITMISESLADRILYIADGHHRYETALAYRNSHRPPFGDGGFNFVMMTLTDSQAPNLVMLPIHRLVRGLEEAQLASLKEELANRFEVKELLSPTSSLSETVESWPDCLKEQGQQGTVFGLYGLHGQCLLKVRQKETIQQMRPQPDQGKDLDASILHGVILRGMLNIDSPEKEMRHLEYTTDGLEAISRVNSGECQLAFLVNPTPIASVLAIADAGTRMPAKSTYFYPKTPAGLIIYPLWDEH